MKYSLLMIFGLLVVVSPQSRSVWADSRKPNLIVVMVDDMGYAGVSCFGNPYFKTPEIDRLAAEGMRLTDFHSSGTVCSPTRAGLLTGRYQQRAGIEAVIHPVADHPEHRKGLRLQETTFAESLKQAGYATGLIGKWHQGYPQNSQDYHPQNHGFDEFVGYHSGNIDFVSHVGDHSRHDWWHGREETKEAGYSTHLINRHSVEFVRRHGPQENPFCLYIAHEAIHNPVQVPGDPVRRTLDGWDRWNWRKVSQQERIEKYRGMTLAIDQGIGQLRETLIDLGIEKDTFVLFFSDNGPAGDFPSGSPRLRGGKGTVYEGGHKVPAIAWWPGTIEAGAVSEQPLISIDIMPTLLELAGAKSPKRPLDGVDVSSVLLRREPLADRPLFWASLSNNGRRSEAMREGPWKLVVNHPKASAGTFENEAVELYDLPNDPSEKENVAKSHADTTREMLARLKTWYAETQATATPQPGGWLAKKPDDGITAEPVRKPIGAVEKMTVVVRSANETSRSRSDQRQTLKPTVNLPTALIQSIHKETLRRNRDGSSLTWFHPRACMAPNADGRPTALMTLQEIGGSDYFGQVHWSESEDKGRTWTEPAPIAALGRDPVAEHPGLLAGVCDVTPQFHPQTGTVLALGHVVFYRGPRFAKGDQLARYPVYVVRRKDGSWSPRKILKWDDPRGKFIYSNNCGQREVMPNGDVMMSFTFGPEANNRMVAGVRCSFDGEELKIIEVGPALRNDIGRGLLEPSLARFQGRFYLTMRAEDGHGYVAVSDDGLNYGRKTAWAWDDGQPVGMSTTQQHWLPHSEGLFLVYTRKDASNTNVIRWRSPLWIARVDTKRLCLVRQSEQVVLPLVGNGVDKPDEVALMGNFNVTNIGPHESWVTVGEWMPRGGARGDLLMSRILWSRPNLLAPNVSGSEANR